MMQHKKAAALILAFLVIIVGAIGYVLVTAEKLVPGAISYHLPARCEIIYFDTSLQPTRTLALACPGVDMIRFWPLPIQNPWFEDRIKPSNGDLDV